MTAALLTKPGLFAALDDQPLDSMLGLLHRLRRDPRPDKIDLGIGVYGDETGQTPVMRAVKEAEAQLQRHQPSKSYVAAEGDARFTELMAPLVLGADRARDDRYIGLQTPGGTGALRLAAELIARAHPDSRVWLGTPTWVNHRGLMQAAGLQVLEHPFFDKTTQTVQFDAMMHVLETARAGDVVLLHACCHNPTGAEFTFAQWQAIGDLCARKGLLPLIDIAYQGLGHGFEEDAAGMHTVLDKVPEAIIAASCSKNFALYRERIGALWVKADSTQTAMRARGNLILTARTMWSMPPDHGAAIVRTILESDHLTGMWRTELNEMRTRLNAVRADLAAALSQLAAVADQTGLFALLPLSREQVVELRDRHGIYMLDSGRINIAGLQSQNLPRFAAILESYL